MNPKEFISFLNGAVELGGLKELNKDNYKVLQSYLVNVDNSPTQEGVFCTWLKGFLEAKDSEVVNTKDFTKILEKMNESMKNNDIKDFKNPGLSFPKHGSELPRC